VKSKNHAVKPQCLTVLMNLRIKDINLDHEKQIEMKQKKLTKKERMLSSSKRDRKVRKFIFLVKLVLFYLIYLACQKMGRIEHGAYGDKSRREQANKAEEIH